ncbi:MAG: hypothetical protein M1834_005122 [Cirrosporium novae-zelandiae]|nr:MAG: hypothetical protein M1834_005122 [Cirrosporium novae-zelandiae]
MLRLNKTTNTSHNGVLKNEPGRSFHDNIKSRLDRPMGTAQRLNEGRRKEVGRPGLNLVTEFDLANVQTPEKDQTTNMHPAGFVDLADLKALGDAKPSSQSDGALRQETNPFRQRNRPPLRLWDSGRGIGFRSKKQPKPRRALYQGLDEESREGQRFSKDSSVEGDKIPQNSTLESHTKRKSSSSTGQEKINELSPSDRPIPIGLAVDSTFGDFNTQRQDPTTPATPSILITPAAEEPAWSRDKTTLRQRPSSSIYSQATPIVGIKRASTTPPVPKLPEDVKRRWDTLTRSVTDDNISSSIIDDDYSVTSRKRTYSTGILFDNNDNSWTFNRRRTLSLESLSSLRRSHASVGWWNIITTPFLSRSNTGWTRKSTATLSPQDKGLQTPFSEDEKRLTKWPTQDPQNPSRCSSIWTDMSEWERNREKVGPSDTASRSVLEKEGDIHDENGPFWSLQTSDSIPTIGAAVEYYTACRHDQNFPYAYFECMNHTCSYSDVADHRGSFTKLASPTTRGGLGDLNKELGDVDEEIDGAGSDADETEEEIDGANRETDVEGKEMDRPTKEDHNLEASPKEKGALNLGTDVRNKDSPDPEPPSELEADTNEEIDVSHKKSHESQASFAQLPSNRFSAAFAQPTSSRERANSDATTEIDDEPDISPNVRRARRATFIQASSPISTVPSRAEHRELRERSLDPEPQSGNQTVVIPPPYSPPRTAPTPLSPEPISPGLQRAMTTRGNIPLNEVTHSNDIEGSQDTNHTYLRPRPAPARNMPFIGATDDIEDDQFNINTNTEKEPTAAREIVEPYPWDEERKPKRKGCFSKAAPKTRKKKIMYMGIFTGLLIMIVIIVVLVMTLTRKGDGTPVESEWMNITGFPPIPTGISTIAQPQALVENTGCVHPATLWSCAVPKEQQGSIAPNQPDQPNFRLEIRFKNQTITNTTSSNDTTSTKVRARDALSNELFVTSPLAPSFEDQMFLGNTTDNNTEPFQGEATPFYITFLSSTKIPSSRLTKRLQQRDSSSNSSDFPDLTDSIPAPDVDSDGTAAAANILPTPSSQPLRLYDRGLPTEHYGFYNYFDRSIFLKSTALLNSSDASEVSDDENGGSTKSEANVRCTWAQTRFLVQIWTNLENSSELLQSTKSSTTSTATSSASQSTSTSFSDILSSSANNFTRPGSFPYPVTITLDRHGGNIHKKMIYCYGMNNQEEIVKSEKKIQLEYRGFGGQLVNPAQGPFGNVNVTYAEGGPGGIDGGSGGCKCQWSNFEKVS